MNFYIPPSTFYIPKLLNVLYPILYFYISAKSTFRRQRTLLTRHFFPQKRYKIRPTKINQISAQYKIRSMVEFSVGCSLCDQIDLKIFLPCGHSLCFHCLSLRRGYLLLSNEFYFISLIMLPFFPSNCSFL